jgi:hypothetical protein
MAMNDDDILDYIEDSRNLRATGMELEFDYDENDMLVMKPYSEMSTLESISIGLEKVGSAATGIAGGALSATAGFIPDLTVALPVAVKDALSAEDGKKLKAFGETFERLSKENFGVEFYRGLFDNAIDSLDLSEELKKDAKSGFNLGEFFDFLGPAYAAVKKGPQIVRGVKNKMQQVSEAAQKRLDEDKGSVTVSSMGVGEMGRMVDKGLSKLAPTEGKVVNLKPKTDRLNFYSKAEEVTNQLKQNKGTGQQYRQQLLKAGVKPDEIEWLGLDDVLNKGKITKQEIQDQINANRIELDEVELSGTGIDSPATRFNENETVMSAEDAYGPEYLNNRADEIFKDGIELDENRKYTIEDAYKQAKDEYDINPVMKYVDPQTGYTITGNGDLGYQIFRSEADSSNFRNAIDFPDTPYSLNEAVIRAENDMMERGDIMMYGDGSRLGEGTRFEEYTEPGGDNYREFLIRYDNPRERNEVQFDDDHFGIPGKENVIAHFRTKDRTTSDGKKVFYIEEIQSDWGQKGRQSGFKKPERKMVEISNKRKQAQKKLDEYEKIVNDSGEDLAGKDLDEATSLRMYLQQTQNFVVDNDKKVFKAPFITDTDKWTQLTLKRILSKAVDEGYDFVSITPGKAQMDRWNNEGVAKFYDEIVPKNAEKIVKKLDKNAIRKDKQVLVTDREDLLPDNLKKRFPYAQIRFSIELTPQLKEKVKKGMAMFSATPLVVGQENE